MNHLNRFEYIVHHRYLVNIFLLPVSTQLSVSFIRIAGIMCKLKIIFLFQCSFKDAEKCAIKWIW